MYKRILPMFPQGKQKVFTISYDDGITSDRPLVELMGEYGIRGTFNVNSGMMPPEPEQPKPGNTWAVMTAEECRALYGENAEIAVHGERHMHWTEISSSELLRDILTDKENLERLFGGVIRGSAAPFGSMDARTTELVGQCGLDYCRNSGCTYDLQKLPMDPKEFLSLTGTVRSRQPELMPLAERFTEKSPGKRLWMLYVWGHTYEFERTHSWQVIESLFKLVSGREDIWFATNIEMVDYLKAMRRLRFNVEETMVENPTAQELWIRVRYDRDHTPLVRIPGGETVILPEREG